MEHTYEVDLSWTEERSGTLRSAELDAELTVATPPPFPKGIPRIWSPEHLFTAAVSSCLMTTFLAIAEKSKLEITSLDIKATGKMEVVDGKYIMSAVTLRPQLGLARTEDTDKAMRIIEKAEQACLISNSVKSKIILEPTITVG